MSKPTVTSCGLLLWRDRPQPSFLVLTLFGHQDLPKGLLDAGEDEVQGALRELREETGIPADAVAIDSGFRFVTQYRTSLGRGKGSANKIVIIFLARLLREVPIRLTEHHRHDWIEWRRRDGVKSRMIGELLEELALYFAATT